MHEILLAFISTSASGVLTLGFLLGLKHALESDHLAAVSTIVTERKSLWSSAIVGGIWGLGHTISLFVAGVFVLLLNFQISEQTERMLEFCVGAMLILLGLNVLRKLLFGATLNFQTHEHDGSVHAHLFGQNTSEAPHAHHNFSFSPRALIVGMIHGLAGSAALMLLVIPTIESRPLGLLYILIFGAGSIGGMMLMSLLVGLPFSLTAGKFNRLNHAMQSLAGIASVGIGLLIVYEKGITEGLLG